MLNDSLLQVREFLRGLHGVVAEDKEKGGLYLSLGKKHTTQTPNDFVFGCLETLSFGFGCFGCDLI